MSNIDNNSEMETPITESDSNDVKCCSPHRPSYRFFGLFFMCFLGFGSYFCYDNPGALQNEITEDMNVNTFQFSLLYSVYSWPNVALCFVGGFLLDRVFGIRWGTIIFSSLVTAGQYVFAFGALWNEYWLMLTGRLIFGVGAESLAVAQNTYTVSWFKGKELNTVFGLLLSMSRIGSTVNFLTMESIYNWVDNFKDGYTTLGIALIIAGFTCVASLLSAIVLGILDKKRAEVLKLDDAKSGEKVRATDVLTFPASFWLISAICVTYYVTIFPFIGLAKVFFMRKYGFSDSLANAVSSVVYIISAIFSPIMGFIVDKTGRNIFWVFLAVLVTLGCHSLLAFTFVNPFVSMIFFYYRDGESIAHLLKGLHTMQSIQNLGLALISMLGGYIVDNNGYFILEIFYIIWLCVALACTIAIWLVDQKNGGMLMMNNQERNNLTENSSS